MKEKALDSTLSNESLDKEHTSDIKWVIKTKMEDIPKCLTDFKER